MSRIFVPQILAPIFILMLTGCGGANVVVESDFPEPLVDSLPLQMGVYYSKEFREFSHEEKKDKKSPGHRITTGASQVKLFNRLFKNFFESTTELTSLPTADHPLPLNAILAPEVEELQFTVPRDTNSEVFEVWVKYKMKLYSPQGDLILDGSIPAYGKTPVAFMKSRDKALEQAAIVALRDAGAHFTISFSRLPKLQRWLDTQMVKPSEKATRDKVMAVGVRVE